MLGAGDRMRGHEMHAGGKMRRHVLDHRRLDGADVGDGGARFQVRGDFGGDRPAGADRNADDDEVGARGRLGIGVDDAVGDAQFDDALARLFRAGGGDDLAHHALLACRPRDRRADQADADQGEAIVENGMVTHTMPRHFRLRVTPVCP